MSQEIPIRRLFAELSSDAKDRVKTSSRSRDEAMEACRRSTERLRELFHFDVDNMTPVRKPFKALRSTDPTQVSTSSIPTSANPSTRDAGLPQWNWEEIPLDSCYVPQFYHARYYHSDTRLFMPSRRVQCTSNKTQYIWPKDKHAVHAHNCKILEGLTQTEPHRTARSTLFGFWCARIRRASHTEIRPKEMKETENYFNTCTPPLSNEQLPTTSTLVAISVPVNSPVNPMHQRVIQMQAWQWTSNGFIEGSDLLVTSQSEATKQRTTQRTSGYRRLSILGK
ncbi:unnamed protein product [Dicrocoelium dendriticum]|nr:unnamed protein product [Dicrocoelium dendriticum]